MSVKAKLSYAKMSAQKARLVVDQIRLLPVDQALDTLSFSKKKAAVLVKKVLSSAIANAETNNGSDIDDLYISQAYVDEGPSAKRFRARARGRGNRIIKRSCHITVAVADKSERK